MCFLPSKLNGLPAYDQIFRPYSKLVQTVGFSLEITSGAWAAVASSYLTLVRWCLSSGCQSQVLLVMPNAVFVYC